MSATPPTGASVVKQYLDQNFRCVFWPAIGDVKGPREEGWPRKLYTLADYQEGYRVGLMTGVEVTPGYFLHDVDIDWEPGSAIAQMMLPSTGFVFGRPSKKISHCFYTLAVALPSFRFEDVDKTCLIEFRGTKANGEIGLQTMAPPSMWSKDGKKELLAFVAQTNPAHVDHEALKHRVTLAAIGLILAKNLGKNGFGHEVRLAVAGFLLRLGLTPEEVIKLGEAISPYTNNTEVSDVRRSVESTVAGLAADGKKVKGGPTLAKILGANGKAIVARIAEWLGRNQDFIRNQNGVIIARHQDNIKRAVELLGHELTHDEFADQMLFDGRPLEDPQWKSLYFDIESEFRFSPPLEYYRMTLEDIAHRNKFHPVKQYLEPLVWDGVPRIDAWLITAANVEDTPYVRAISSIMLIAAVRRIYHPGAKYDEMVVWESAQGMNKSTAAQALCPNQKWFSDDLRLNVGSKELIEGTLGKWIIEASDLAGKRKAEVDLLKAVMSRQVDGPARMAYAHSPVTRPRQFIWIGTTNSSAYLNDSTGARRFWPVTVQRFDIAWIIATRDQLWAEAVTRERKGESIRLPEELWPEAGVEQEKRQEIDPWETTLRQAVLAIEPSYGGARRVATKTLWEALAVVVERRDRQGSTRITEIMRRLGFRRVKVRSPEGEVQVGFVQETDTIDIEEQEETHEAPVDKVPF